jgi:hypothetical protein
MAIDKNQAIRRLLQAAGGAAAGYVGGTALGAGAEAAQNLISPLTGLPANPDTEHETGNVGALIGAGLGALSMNPMAILARARASTPRM